MGTGGSDGERKDAAEQPLSRHRRRRLRWSLSAAAVLATVALGCGGGDATAPVVTAGTGQDSRLDTTVAAGGTGTVEPATTVAAGGTGTVEPATTVALDPANFTDPTTIDNPWFPMVPGTQLVLEGEANRGGGLMPHRVFIIVTDLTKVIDGVRTRVVYERDENEGVLRESEIAFFAQDDSGNLWNLGEYPEEYEARRFIGAPSTWISGHDGAVGGIHVQGEPEVGTPAYQAGSAQTINFLDYAKVSATGAEACAPVGCFEDVLVVDEWDPLDQPADGHQLKHYAPGVGPVRVDPLGGLEQETLVLAESNELDGTAMDEARDRALRLDTRAYEVAPRIWAATAPAEPDA